MLSGPNARSVKALCSLVFFGLVTSAAAESLWEHNGSVMQLRADGTRRSFEYVVPRAGLREVGVVAGAVLFEGSQTGDQYSGTAYLFSKACGRIGYPVKGPASKDQRKVKLSGRAPKRNSKCKTVGHRDDALVFNYQSTAVDQQVSSPAGSESQDDHSPSRPAENWEGYWALETHLCQFKDKVGTTDPAPIHLDRDGMMGQEHSCKAAEISSIGDEVELRLKCAGEGMEYEDRVSIRVIGTKTLRMRRDGEKSKFFHRCD